MRCWQWFGKSYNGWKSRKSGSFRSRILIIWCIDDESSQRKTAIRISLVLQKGPVYYQAGMVLADILDVFTCPDWEPDVRMSLQTKSLHRRQHPLLQIRWWAAVHWNKSGLLNVMNGDKITSSSGMEVNFKAFIAMRGCTSNGKTNERVRRAIWAARIFGRRRIKRSLKKVLLSTLTSFTGGRRLPEPSCLVIMQIGGVSVESIVDEPQMAISGRTRR